jgi:hypothetical protein
MKTPRWIVGATVALLLSACADTSAAPASSMSGGNVAAGASSGGPTDLTTTRLAEFGFQGGFVGPQATVLRPPSAVLYGDGTVVLDAARTYRLPSSQMRKLVMALQADLAGRPDRIEPGGGVGIADAPDTVLGVRKAGGYQKTAVVGLAQLGADGHYPGPVLDAYKRLKALADTEKTTPYTSKTVRVSYACTQSPASGAWPQGLPVPTATTSGGCGQLLTLSGAKADAARAACSQVTDGGMADYSKAYSVGEGVVGCSWRPALPDEV